MFGQARPPPWWGKALERTRLAHHPPPGAWEGRLRPCRQAGLCWESKGLCPLHTRARHPSRAGAHGVHGAAGSLMLCRRVIMARSPGARRGAALKAARWAAPQLTGAREWSLGERAAPGWQGAEQHAPPGVLPRAWGQSSRPLPRRRGATCPCTRSHPPACGGSTSLALGARLQGPVRGALWRGVTGGAGTCAFSHAPLVPPAPGRWRSHARAT